MNKCANESALDQMHVFCRLQLYNEVVLVSLFRLS